MRKDLLESIYEPELAYEYMMYQGTYNNVGFYWSTPKLLRFKLDEIRDWGNEFKSIPPLEELAKLDMFGLEKVCNEVFDADNNDYCDYWLGDDYEDIMGYFDFLTANGSGYSYRMLEHGRDNDDWVSVERTSLEDAKREYEFIKEGLERREEE